MPLLTQRRQLILPSSAGIDNPSSPYPLDAGIFSSAYSLRKLRFGSTAAIRVQRSSDNAQQDIGFLGRDLDIIGLLNFCAGSTGTLVKWYDQSLNNLGVSNGHDLIQNTLAAQPVIVNAGKLIFLPNSARLGVSFDGNRYMATGTGYVLVLPLTHFAVVSPSASNGSVGTIGGSTNVGSPHLFAYAGNTSQFKFNTFVSLTAVGAAPVIPRVVMATGDYHDSFMEISPNFSRGYTGTAGLAGFEMGSCQGGANKFIGVISEYFIYASISQNRKSKIAREMAAYYGLAYSFPAFPAYTKIYVFAGDSLTYGQNSTGSTNDWPSKYISKLGAGTYLGMNTGFPGHTLVDMSARASSESGLLNYFYPAPSVMLWVTGGTNDIINGEQSANTAYTRLIGYITAAAASGKFSQIGVCTLPPSGATSGAFAQVIHDYNVLVRAGMAPGGTLLTAGATALCDLQTNGVFDDTPANVTTVTHNATYFNQTDFTHGTDALYDLWATLAVAAGT
jgi:hypothetical protein